MMPTTTEIDSPVVDSHHAKLLKFFIAAYMILFQWVSHIVTVAAISISGGLVAPLRHLWARYYNPRVAFGEAGVVMPYSALSFIIKALLAFAQIKAQCVLGFPFQTHPQIIMLSVTSLLMYGLASAIELVVSAASLDPNSIYAIVVHFAKLGSLCLLVTSLASLFYT